MSKATHFHVLSNFAYAMVGVASLILLNSLTLFLGFIILAFTSRMGHWKGGKWWIADWIGMYVAFLAIILFNLGVSLAWWFIAPLVALWAWYYHTDSFIRIGAFGAVAIISAYFAFINIVPSIILFAIAFAVRQSAPSMENKYYNITHSIWHILTALAMFFLVYNLIAFIA
jgi:hypothetical protein